MTRVPDPGRFELRLMDGSTNPYLLQAGVIAAGIDGLEKKRDPGQPLFVNMYKDAQNYPNIKKLPTDLEESLENLGRNEILNAAFGEKVLKSYLKLSQKTENGTIIKKMKQIQGNSNQKVVKTESQNKA